MDIQSFLLGGILLIQIVSLFLLFLQWDRSRNFNEKDRKLHEYLNKTLQDLESRLINKIDYLININNLQNKFIPEVYKKPVENKNESSVDDTKKLDDGDESVGYNDAVTGTYALGNNEGTLDDLLNNDEFFNNYWQNLNGSFLKCKNELAKFITDNGHPQPEIEPYPALGDLNQSHWKFLVVQVQNPSSDSKRFLVPQCYDRYEVVRHAHLFDVMGTTSNPNKFIKKLHQCAILKSSGALEGHIDKSLVEKKGSISLD